MKKKLLPDKKDVFNNDLRLEMGVEILSERENVEKTVPLKGADRTMVLKDNID